MNEEINKLIEEIESLYSKINEFDCGESKSYKLEDTIAYYEENPNDAEYIASLKEIRDEAQEEIDGCIDAIESEEYYREVEREYMRSRF